MKMRLNNIQRFSTKDGPGIRTTLFSQGCAIRCPWCANPECLEMNEDTFNCRIYDVEEVWEICQRDKAFYGEDGGITASGGEALLQAEAFAELFVKAKNEAVGTCIETALYAPVSKIDSIIPVTDYWYIDFKVMNEADAKKYLKAEYRLFLDNLENVFANVEREKICVRVPLVRGITYTGNNIDCIENMLKEYTPGRCELFSVHNLGKPKYEKLGLAYKEFDVIEASELETIAGRFEKNINTKVVINKL